MQTNVHIIDFLKQNYLLVIIFLLFIPKIIPPEWCGFWKYNKFNDPSSGLAPKITILKFILNNIVDSILSAFLIPILAIFGLKHMVTLVILVVVFFNIVIQKEISVQAVTLVGIGIITLYLERLIETGKHIKLFGGLIDWEKNDP